ncbi:MAG: SDR family NAD(P)-dependent oxidoreductase [Verrucomicrobiota bacterium]|nr:SDR family NAD(P)-dependent oxidoreductase [Verrucomicrobiota bacterium]
MSKNIFITGVSSGIGLALAEEFLRRNNTVYGLSRRKPVQLMGHPQFQFKQIDLELLEGTKPEIKELLKDAPQLDLVILNAAILGPIADLAETSLHEVKRVMDINLWANKVVLDCFTELALPVTQVVAISSGAASSANRGWNSYSISKAALNMLIALYAAEQMDTHFTALAPGIVDTPMQAELAEVPHDGRFNSLETLRQARGTPMMPEPEEAAERLITAFESCKHHSSGSFLDVNSLVRRSFFSHA